MVAPARLLSRVLAGGTGQLSICSGAVIGDRAYINVPRRNGDRARIDAALPRNNGAQSAYSRATTQRLEAEHLSMRLDETLGSRVRNARGSALLAVRTRR